MQDAGCLTPPNLLPPHAHTHSGEIIIGARVNGDNVEVCVQDSGIGIPGDKFEQIFQAFEQVGGESPCDAWPRGRMRKCSLLTGAAWPPSARAMHPGPGLRDVCVHVCVRARTCGGTGLGLSLWV